MPQTNVVKLTALGEFRNTSGSKIEIWTPSISLYGGATSESDANPPYTPAEQLTLATAGWQFFHDVMAAIGPNARVWLTGCKAAYVTSTGKYPPTWSDGTLYSASIHEATYQGGAVTEHVPTEVAMCITNRVIPGTGRKSGRFYMPAPELTLTNGEWAASDVDSIVTATVTAVHTLITAIASVPSWSGAGAWNLTVPTYKGDFGGTPVKEIAIGLVPDVQRRRRNKLVENYQAGAL